MRPLVFACVPKPSVHNVSHFFLAYCFMGEMMFFVICFLGILGWCESTNVIRLLFRRYFQLFIVMKLLVTLGF